MESPVLGGRLMTDKNKTEERRLHGTWSHLTMDALVETAVRARPSRRSFADAPDMGTWSDQTPKLTNAGEFGTMVQTFARQIMTLGLKQGDAVLVAMPNTVDGVVALLGLMAAGLVPCPVSVVASAIEIQHAAEILGAKAIITTNRYAHLSPSLAAREAASKFYGVRFVCAFGLNAPEGVVSLEGWKPEELWQDELPANAPTDIALITLDTTGETIVPHARTHAQLISDALALSAISGLTGRGAIIATFAPVSAAGFVSTVASPLISGTTVSLHGPFDAEVLRQQLAITPEAIVVLPAVAEAAIRHGVGDALKDAIVVTRDLETTRPKNISGRVTELVSLGEVALWSLLRDNSRPKQRLPRFYAHPVGTALPRTMAQIEATISARGRLALQGFGVARERLLPATGQTSDIFETRWLAHGDGPEHFSAVAEDTGALGEDILFSVAAA
jgi:mycobactin salicyl-AMP ligase